MEKIDVRKLPRCALKEMRSLGHAHARSCAIDLEGNRQGHGCEHRHRAGLVPALCGKTPDWSPESRVAPSSRDRTLTLAQEWATARHLDQRRPPQVRGLEFALWSRRAVMQLIEKLFGIDRDAHSHRRPISAALGHNRLDVERWMKVLYPVIAQHAKERGAFIYWVDETAVAQDGLWVRGYPPPAGQTPMIEQPSKRYGLTMVSAVSSQGLVRFEFMQGAMTTQRGNDFMQRLIQDSQSKVNLILDNFRAHQAKEVTQWLQQHQDQIEVLYLPPYAPQSNQDEYHNENFKKHLRSAERSGSKEQLLKKAENFMRFLQATPQRVRAYFNKSAVKYAA